MGAGFRRGDPANRIAPGLRRSNDRADPVHVCPRRVATLLKPIGDSYDHRSRRTIASRCKGGGHRFAVQHVFAEVARGHIDRAIDVKQMVNTVKISNRHRRGVTNILGNHIDNVATDGWRAK